MKPPTQAPPWIVEAQGDDFVVIDANGFYVANFGRSRSEPDFVCSLVNRWHQQNKKTRGARR